MSRWFWNEFLPVLDDLLSEWAPEGELIRLDQLDLQLPPLQPGQWRLQLTAAVTAALREHLERLIRSSASPTPGTGSVERIPLAQGHFEAWLWFLEYGHLPAQYADSREEVRLQAALENVAANTGALNRLLGLLRQSPTALQRLVRQHDTEFLIQLSTAITGQPITALSSLPLTLLTLLTGAPLRTLIESVLPPSAGPVAKEIPERQLKTRFWQQVFEAIAGGSQSFDIQTFTEIFFEKQFEELFSIPFETVLKQAARLAGPDHVQRTALVQGLEYMDQQATGNESLRQYFRRETEIIRQKSVETPPPSVPARKKGPQSGQPDPFTGEGHPEEYPADKSPFEAWLWFLQNGRFPPVSSSGTLTERLSAVLEAIPREPAAVRQLSRLIRHQPKALQRLVLEHDTVFLAFLVEAVTGKNMSVFSGMPAVFYKALTGAAVQGLAKQALPQAAVFNAIVVPETSFEIWYWQELLVACTADAQGFDYQTFSNTFFKRAFALIYRIPYDELIGHILNPTVFSEKQRVAILRKLDRIERGFAGTEVLKAFFQQEMEPLRGQLPDTGKVSAAEPAMTPATPPGETVAGPAEHFAAWTWFLQYGNLPSEYVAIAVPETTRLAAVLESLATRPVALKTLRRLLQRQPAAMERLILQHQSGFLEELAVVLSGGQTMPHLSRQPAALYTFLAGSPVQELVRQALPHDAQFSASPLVARQWEIWFWNELFRALAVKPKNFDYQSFIGDFFHWSFQQTYKTPFREWTKRATRLATSAGKKRTALLRQLTAVSRQLAGDEVLRDHVPQELDVLRRGLTALPAQAGAPSYESPPADQAKALPPASGAPSPVGTPPAHDGQLLPKEEYALPEDSESDRKRPATEAPKIQYLQNAGLVLLHPFLVALFQATGITQDKEFTDEEARIRAVQLLHFLATGSDDTPEYALGMPKLLCGMAHDMPVDRQSLLSAAEREEGDAMLQAVVGHWGALGQASNDGLREGFLQREGKLSRRDGDWLLQVESKTIDILMGRLPWGLSVVKLPWMPEILHIEWI